MKPPMTIEQFVRFLIDLPGYEVEWDEEKFRWLNAYVKWVDGSDDDYFLPQVFKLIAGENIDTDGKV